MCRIHVSAKCFHWIHVSDTCVGQMFSVKTFGRHMCRIHVSDTCIRRMFSVDTCVGHMCQTHVSYKCFYKILKCFQWTHVSYGHKCPQNVFSGYIHVFSGHMCRTHVSDTCVLVCSGL